MPFQFERQVITDIVLVKPKIFSDDRGFFMETYKYSDYVDAGLPPFVQDNYSHSSYGVLRGLHYQNPPAAQGKLVSVIQGEIFDVAVDIRQGSPTYRQWMGVTLSAVNHYQLYVPPGFAHGFCVLSHSADVVYKVTSEYSSRYNRGICWNDPDIQIQWPLDNPQLSTKDQDHPTLAQADNDFTWLGSSS